MRLTLFLLLLLSSTGQCLVDAGDRQQPSVMLAMLVRNKQPFLPHVLSRLTTLTYPQPRVALWIRSDHNEDQSAAILRRWLDLHSHHFHSTDVLLNSSAPRWSDERSATDLSPTRYRHVIALKQEALQAARRMWADYVWFLDADVILRLPSVLSYLVSLQKPIVAPMLPSIGVGGSLYSNFWGAMDDNFYYRRSDDYLSIYRRDQIGCFAVPLVHSCVLIDLRLEASLRLTFNRSLMQHPQGPVDDLISFSLSAKQAGLETFVCNERRDGDVPVPLDAEEDLSVERLNVRDILLATLTEDDSPPVDAGLELLEETDKDGGDDARSRLGFDKIYVINLARRPDRKMRMMRSLNVLQLQADVVEAVDGHNIDERFLIDNNIQLMSDYEDPYWRRPIKMGEIACFLSHYSLWKQVLEQGYRQVMVLEDDVRFGPRFNQRVRALMAELQRLELAWDLIYLGRKILERDESLVNGSSLLAHPHYSYWTIGYVLSTSGARALLEPRPLSRLLPVDEYIPLMFDRHANDTWKAHFPERRLRAFSAVPLLLEPLHYTSEPGYVSDTEDSGVACVAAALTANDVCTKQL